MNDGRLQFQASDLERLEGRFNTVICLDVFIHYPQPQAELMVAHLAAMAGALDRELCSLHAAVGSAQGHWPAVPGPSKTTRAYTLKESGIVAAAKAHGFVPKRRQLNQAPFYFSRLIEFVRG